MVKILKIVVTLLIMGSFIIIPANPIAKTNNTNKIGVKKEIYPILFVPGVFETKDVWNFFINWFVQDGWNKSLLFNYDLPFPDSCNSASNNIYQANVTAQRVVNILNETGAQKVDIIAAHHGGWVARYFIKFLGGLNEVHTYINIAGSQHGGTSCNTENKPTNFQINNGDETPGGLMSDTIGRRIDPIDSTMLYNGTHIPGNISYTSIYSVDDKIIPSNSPPLDGAHNIEISSAINQTVGHYDYLNISNIYKVVRDEITNAYITVPYPSTNTQTQPQSTPSFTALLFLGVFSLIVVIRKKKK